MLCAIVDIFDALTSGNSKGASLAVSVDKACQKLVGQADTAIDAEMVKCWVATVKMGFSSEKSLSV